MVDEISLQIKLGFSKGASGYDIPVQNFLDDMTGTEFALKSQVIGFAAAENLDKGEIGTVGWIWVKNKDATNFVNMGHDDGGFKSDIIVKPLKQVLYYAGIAVPQGQADTGNVAVDMFMIEV